MSGLLTLSRPASAQTYTWNVDASSSWNTAGNWNPAVIPNGQGVTAIFGGVITANRTVTLDSDVTVGSIAFENTGLFSYTLGGSAIITLNNGASPASISVAATSLTGQTITRHFIAQSDVAITNNSLTAWLDLQGGINLGARTLTVSGPGTTYFSFNPITGSTGSKLVLDGPGKVFLQSINNGIKYEVKGGTLYANAAGALQPINAGILTPDLITLSNGGTINFLVQQTQRDFTGITLGAGGGRIASEAGSPVILSAPITGAGSLTKTGPQTIALAAASNYNGETIIRQGALRIDANAPNGLNGALGNATSAVILGDNVGGNSTALLIGVNGVAIGRDIAVVASPAPGTSTVKIGSGSLSLGGTFSGTITLNRTLTLSGGSSSAPITFGRITGTGGVIVDDGFGILTSSASDFVGRIEFETAGTLSISSDAQLGAAGNDLYFDGGHLRVTGSTPFGTSRPVHLNLRTALVGGEIEVQNTDAVTGFTIQSGMTGTGPLRKTGPGILTLSGANTFGSATAVEQGTLQVTAANVLSPYSQLVVHSGATVKLNGFSQQIASLANGDFQYTGSIDLGSTTGTVLTVGRDGVSTGGGGSFFDQNISGTGDLVKTGLGGLQLGGTRSYTGTTTVRQGNLEVHSPVPASGNGALGNSSGGAIRLGDANFAGFNAALLNADTTTGFARPITVVAGAGQRTLGHRVFGTTENGKTVSFSGPIVLEKELHLYSIDHINSDVTLRINGVISGTAGLVKTGGGVALLAADNTYTGTTTVLSGRLAIGTTSTPDAAARSSAGFVVRTNWSDPGPGLEIGHSPAPDDRIHADFLIQDFAPNPNRLGDGDVTLSQGKFRYWGQDAGASSESFRNLIIQESANALELVTPIHANTTSATLSMTGGLIRNNRGTLRVNSTGLGNPDGVDFTRIQAASPPALVGGGGSTGSTNISILPWAYHGMGPDVLPSWNFLTYGPTGLRPLAASEYTSSLTAPGELNNVRITVAATTLNQNQTINSLFYDAAANGAITLTGQTLAVNSGAVLSRSDLLTLDGGTLNFGAAEGIIHSTDFASVTINSTVSGTGGLTSHLGFGATLALNGVNTYTGPTTINSGNVSFNNAASFGTGNDPIRLRWGWTRGTGNLLTYTGTGATTLAKPIEIGPGTNGFQISTGGTLTMTGVISGAGLDPLNDAVSFNSLTGTFELRAANTFTGNVRLFAGTLGIVADNNLGPTTNRLTLGSGSGNIATLRFDAAGITIARPISVGGHANLRTTGADVVISGPISGAEYPTNLTKVGAGSLTLTGTHTYGATTHISGGTLQVNGTLTGSFQTGLVHVNNAGTLAGNGTINRLVRVNTGGTLAPGAGVGTLTLGALEFNTNATATYLWEAGASAQDQIVVTGGPVSLSGIQVTLGLYDRGLGTAVTPEMQFALLTVAGANSITGFNPANFTVAFADTPNWSTTQYSLSVVQLGGNSVLMLSNIAPVPEPAGILAAAGAALSFAFAVRRRWLGRQPS